MNNLRNNPTNEMSQYHTTHITPRPSPAAATDTSNTTMITNGSATTQHAAETGTTNFPAALYSANVHYLQARERAAATAAVPIATDTDASSATHQTGDTLPRALYARNMNVSRILHARDLAETTVAASKTNPSASDRSAAAHAVHVIRFSDAGKTEAAKSSAAEDDEDADIISDYIGHYGWWQFFWTFLLALFQVPCTFQIFAFVFQAAPQNFWCAPPDTVDLSNISMAAWTNATPVCGAPNATALRHMDARLADYGCERYVFEGPHTVIAEWSLVCERFHLLSVVEMCFLAGAGVGSMCSGWLSDKFGRRHTLMGFVVAQSVLGTGVAFAHTLPMYMLLRTLLGFASMAVMMISFVLLVELVSGMWRTVIGILAILPVACAYILMAGIAYVSPDWRTTQLVVSVPWFAMLLLWYFMPESPRWLLINGRIDELAAVIRVAARWNRIALPANFQKTLQQPDEEVTVAFGELFRGPYLRTSLLMVVSWYTLILLYFGITLHLNNLGGDMYLNTVIAGMLEAVSVVLCIWVVLKFGLRRNLIVFMLVAGGGCMLVNFIPATNNAGIISLAMLGKCAMGATNALIPTYTALQYPTSMRTLSIGLGNLAAGLALVTVPYLWLLEHVERNLPMTIMGVCGVLGAVALMLMRNTNGGDSGGGSSTSNSGSSGRSTSSSSITDDKSAAAAAAKRTPFDGGAQNGAFNAYE